MAVFERYVPIGLDTVTLQRHTVTLRGPLREAIPKATQWPTSDPLVPAVRCRDGQGLVQELGIPQNILA